MKKKFLIFLSLLGHFLIYLTCIFNFPKICAFLIIVSISKNKIFKKKIKAKRINIVLDRAIGHRDIEIINHFTKNTFEFLFLRRSITKIILYNFSNNKRKIFFNYLKPPNEINDYFNQYDYKKKKHEKFWSEVVFNIKKHYKDKILNFITFNYTYYAEYALYAACNNNNVPVKLWYKEGIKTDLEAKFESNSRRTKYADILNYFQKISVYNKLVKKMFISMNKIVDKKISINGSPRIIDYLFKKKYQKNIDTLLFLLFDTKRGIPRYKKNKLLNWNYTLQKVIQILNELSKNKNLNIIVKMKSNSRFKIDNKFDKSIKIFKSGTAEEFINKSDIIIGHNSASTIEALVNGKYVMVPCFEKDRSIYKYLYNFHKDIIFFSEKKMKKKILNLVNKKAIFPINNNKHKITIRYYLGEVKDIKNKYLQFLKS